MASKVYVCVYNIYVRSNVQKVYPIIRQKTVIRLKIISHLLNRILIPELKSRRICVCVCVYICSFAFASRWRIGTPLLLTSVYILVCHQHYIDNQFILFFIRSSWFRGQMRASTSRIAKVDNLGIIIQGQSENKIWKLLLISVCNIDLLSLVLACTPAVEERLLHEGHGMVRWVFLFKHIAKIW